MEKRIEISIIIPIFNEEENLPELKTRLTRVLNVLTPNFEVIFIDDGSHDQSRPILESYFLEDSRFQSLFFSRNFGHQPAISAGMDHALGEAIILMDGDLQDPPELIPDLVSAWKRGFKIVEARRTSRQETGIRRLGFDLFYKIFNLLSDRPMQIESGIFGLMDKSVLLQINRLKEKNRFIPGLRSWVGFNSTIVTYDRGARFAGEAKQTMAKLVRYALDGLLSFSVKPLRFLSWAGLTIFGVGFFVAFFFIIKRILGYEIAFTGFTTLIFTVLILGGLQLLALGIIGEYLGRIYDESKNRPLYIVEKKNLKQLSNSFVKTY